MSGHDLTPDYDEPVTNADLAAVVTEPERLRAENQQLREALERIVETETHTNRPHPASVARAALARVEKSE